MLTRLSVLSMTQVSDLMTPAEVAEAARVSDETVHRWARTGRLPFVKMPSGLKRFRRDAVAAMLRGDCAKCVVHPSGVCEFHAPYPDGPDPVVVR